MKEIRVYFEGGSNYKDRKKEMRISIDQEDGKPSIRRMIREKDRKKAMRKGMSQFLNQMREEYGEGHIKCIACGSNFETYSNFKKSLEDYPNAFNILLVDSDSHVRSAPWDYVLERFGWGKGNCVDEQCHLMVQLMESWIISDITALKGFYGPKFIESDIPDVDDVETLDGTHIKDSLKKATRRTEKKGYRKRHASEILMKMNPSTVRGKASHCDRLFKVLESII